MHGIATRFVHLAAYASLIAKLALRRLRNRLDLTLLCLLGICLSVGLVVAIPTFSELAARLILLQELTDFSRGTSRPLFTMRHYALPQPDWPLPASQVEPVGGWLEQVTRQHVGLPIRSRYVQVESPGMLFEPDTSSAGTPFTVAYVHDVADHLEVLEGEPYSLDDDGDYASVWVQEWLAAKLGLNVGEVRHLAYTTAEGRIRLPIRIAGIWRPAEGSEEFWYGDPTTTLQFSFLTSPTRYRRFVESAFEQGTGFVFWYVVLDDRSLTLDNLDGYAKGLERTKQIAAARLPRYGMDLSPLEPLWQAHWRKTALTTILFGLSLPVLGLLFFFLALISGIAVRYQRAEAAVLASRGATAFHIIGISLAEALALAAVGLPLSLLTGYGFTRLAGQADGFLAFGRRALPATGLHGANWTLVAAALAVTVLMRLAPALAAARHSVVAYERQRSRPQMAMPWLRLSLTVPLLGATVYSYRQLRLRGTLGMLSWEPSGSPLEDPLVFLAPTLFFFSAALLLAAVFPLLMRFVDAVVARRLALPGYLGVRNLGREGGQYASALFLVILCLGVGAFQASVARSANRWFVERLQYRVGADFAFLPFVEEGDSPWLLPVSDYQRIHGVLDVTRVGDYYANYAGSGELRAQKLRLLALDRHDFPRIVYWKRSYASEPLGSLMNRLAAQPDALLVPRQALAMSGLAVGDQISLQVQIGYERIPMTFTIAGVFDYFPTMFPDLGLVAVTNFAHVSDRAGYTPPWSVWMRTAPGMETRRMRLELADFGVAMTRVQDLGLMLENDRSRLEHVGVFGMLSIGFLAAGGVSLLGLLLYIASSLVSRLQRFSVLRAIGCSLNQLLGVIALEFVSVIGYGIGGGLVMGVLASYLFVPYMQLTEDTRLPVPPFEARIAWGDIGAVALAFSAVLGAAAAGLLLGVARRQLVQALRLGDQE